VPDAGHTGIVWALTSGPGMPKADSPRMTVPAMFLMILFMGLIGFSGVFYF
jgi:hypothetical protein